jgi:hypothetical protein
MTPLLGYLICASVFLVVGAALYHVIHVRPMREAHERERHRLEGRLVAMAAEQLRMRARSPAYHHAERHMTIRA